MVRKHVGYARYDTPEAVALLNELYDRLRLMVNFVRPCAKLIEKTRHGHGYGGAMIVRRLPISECWPARRYPRRRNSGCENSSLQSTRSR